MTTRVSTAALLGMLAVVGLVLVTPASSSIAQPRVPGSTPCRADRLTVYKVIFETYWSQKRFPKQYPDWRPKAQWSKVIGRSHSKNYVLWRLGTLATEGVKTFAQTGKTDVLDLEAQGNGGIYDEFLAPPVPVGVGKTQGDFFVDGNHSRVSLMSRLHPSPDWFVGIDSFDLCVQGKWVDAVTLEVDPTDAGTDNGFTFTAPKWATDPQEKIYRLTSQFPSHIANSFYYPRLKKLPPIATFTFIKVKEYELSEVFYHDEKKLSPQRYEFTEETEEKTNIVHRGKIDQDLQTIQRPVFTSVQEPGLDKSNKDDNSPVVRTASPDRGTLPNSIDTAYNDNGNRHTLTARNNTIVTRPGKSHHRNGKLRRGPRNCRTSEWSEWTACSRTCGIGQKVRTRTIIKHERRGGLPCPKLEESSWCGSARCTGVRRKYFDW